MEIATHAVAICGEDQCGTIRHGAGGREDGEGLNDRRGIEAVSEVPRDRPWQIMLTGPGLGAIDAASRQALEQILELFTEVAGLVVKTTAGEARHNRQAVDFSHQQSRRKDEIE
jgi:hypothetical protein